jgi:hypothetical protein
VIVKLEDFSLALDSTDNLHIAYVGNIPEDPKGPYRAKAFLTCSTKAAIYGDFLSLQTFNLGWVSKQRTKLTLSHTTLELPQTERRPITQSFARLLFKSFFFVTNSCKDNKRFVASFSFCGSAY